MAEELDFEAEIPALSNKDNLIEEVENQGENKRFYPENVKDCKSEIKLNTGKLKNIVSVVQSNTNSDTNKIRSNSEDVEKLKNKACNVVSSTEAINIGAVTGSVECDEGKKSNAKNLQSNTSQNKIETSDIQSNTGDVESDNGELESDTGEIASDSEITKTELLEDGEIEDISPAANKNPENICRFFLRGTCMYGLECRYLHVSNGVYNMFDPVLANRSNSNSFPLPIVHRPVLFHPPPPMLMMPNNECPWERGIQKAKIVMKNANYKKGNKDDDENYENDWERCLEVAKQCVQEKLYLKRQNSEVDKPYLDTKYSEREKVRERYPIKRELETNIYKPYRLKSPISSYSKYKKEEHGYEKNTRPETKPTPDHLKWVDPWRRSKSPRKRIRSMSLSVSPSPVRKRSISSSSSSSSCFKERIYGSSHKSNSPKRFRTKSRSNSLSPPPKRSRTVKTRSYSRGRSYTRSFSRSPRKQRSSRSCSSSSSSSSISSEEYYYEEKKMPDKPAVKKFTPFKLETKKEKILPASNLMGHLSSVERHSVTAASGRASSPCRSDKSTCSDITMTSLSYTSLSSLYGKSNSQNSKSKEHESYASSTSKYSNVQRNRSTVNFNRDQRYQRNDSFNRSTNRSESYASRKKLSPERKVVTKYTEESSKGKIKTYANEDAISKSTPKIDVKQKTSKSTMEPLKSDDLISKSPKDKIVSNQKSLKASTEILKKQSEDLNSKPTTAKIAAKQISLTATKASKEPLSKPPLTKSVSKGKPSKAAMELLKYHTFGNKETVTGPVTQPTTAKSVESKLPESNKSISASTRLPQLKESDKNVIPKVDAIKELKPQKPDNSAILKKIAGSKRDMLLQQLQAIEDAIARKKQSVE